MVDGACDGPVPVHDANLTETVDTNVGIDPYDVKDTPPAASTGMFVIFVTFMLPPWNVLS